MSNDNGNAAMGAFPGNPQAPPYTFQDNNYDAFPALPTTMPDQWPSFYPRKRPTQFSPAGNSSPRAKNNRSSGLNPSSRPHSRPTSRHQQRDSPAPSVDDPEAFPTLAALNARSHGKGHRGKRGGQGHSRDSSQKDTNSPNSLADVVRTSQSPGPNQRKSGPKYSRSSAASRENSAAAQAIPTPKHIPWLETGAQANQQYLKYRQDAITHGNVRNKFLQR